jgi:CRP/FNR family transcriptional regulator, cyclic AMP receptor protein
VCPAMARRRGIIETLGQVPLFGACSKSDLKILARHVVEVTVPDGKPVVKQGDQGDAFYVVIEGQATVLTGKKAVATLGPGSWFGELAVLDPGPRNATVCADGDMVVGVLGARVFKAVLRDVPTMTERLLAGMARRLRDADSTLNDIAARNGRRKPTAKPRARKR